MFVFIGPLMVLLQEYLKTHKLDVRYRSIVAGAALAVVILVPISLVKSGGIDGYRRFAQNAEKHTSTPLTNYMGLRTLIAYAPSEAGRFLRSDRLDDPWADWKLTKLRTFRARKALFVAAAAGFGALLWFAVRGVEPWVACSLSATMIAVGVELTCYYYAFLVAVALLYEKRREVGVALLAVTAATGFIDWAPTRFLPDTGLWRWIKMPTWLDEQYMWMAVVTLIGFGWILYRFGFVPVPAPAIAGTAGLPEDADDDAKDDVNEDGKGKPAPAAAAPSRRDAGSKDRSSTRRRKDRRKRS
jgi:hypothetical protein